MKEEPLRLFELGLAGCLSSSVARDSVFYGVPFYGER